jgi:hypothetical protein
MANTPADPDDDLDIMAQFRRLALDEGLKKKSKTYKERRKAFIAEVVETQFGSRYGTNANSVKAWQDLCHTVGLEKAYEYTSVSQCKQVSCRSYDPKRGG